MNSQHITSLQKKASSEECGDESFVRERTESSEPSRKSSIMSQSTRRNEQMAYHCKSEVTESLSSSNSSSPFQSEETSDESIESTTRASIDHENSVSLQGNEADRGRSLEQTIQTSVPNSRLAKEQDEVSSLTPPYNKSDENKKLYANSIPAGPQSPVVASKQDKKMGNQTCNQQQHQPQQQFTNDTQAEDDLICHQDSNASSSQRQEIESEVSTSQQEIESVDFAPQNFPYCGESSSLLAMDSLEGISLDAAQEATLQSSSDESNSIGGPIIQPTQQCEGGKLPFTTNQQAEEVASGMAEEEVSDQQEEEQQTSQSYDQEHPLEAQEQFPVAGGSPNMQNNEEMDDNLIIAELEDEGVEQEIGGAELVEATLIQDAEEEEEHSVRSIEEDSDEGSLPPPPLVRDSTGVVTIDTELAVVEAKPVETVPRKHMSRKLICLVMGLLFVVIGALSVGFVLSAKQRENNENDDNLDEEATANSLDNDTTNSSNNQDNESGATSSGNTPANDVPETTTPTDQDLALPEAAGVSSSTKSSLPFLERIHHGGNLQCGVIRGPGMFYSELDENGNERFAGMDASLCAAVAAAATGDPTRVDYQVFQFAEIWNQLKDGVIDVISGGITHTMERQIQHPTSKIGFAFSVPYLYQGMQLAGEPSFVECGDQGLEYIAACDGIRVCVVDRSTHQQKLSSFLPGRQLIGIPSRELLREGLANRTCNVIAHEGYNLAESLVRAAGYQGEYVVGQTLFSKEPLAMVTHPSDAHLSDFVNTVLQALMAAEADNITQETANMFPLTTAFGENHTNMFQHAIAAGGNYGELYARYLESYSERQGLNTINHDTKLNEESGLLYSHPFGSISEDQGKPGVTLSSIRNRRFLRCGLRGDRPGFVEIVEKDDTSGEIFNAVGIEVDYCRAIAASIFVGDSKAVEFYEVMNQTDAFQRLVSGALDVVAGATWTLENDVRAPSVNEGLSFSQPYFYGGFAANTSIPEANLCLVTKQGDHLWSSFVYWIAAAVINAEETGITQGMSNGMPDVFLFGIDFILMFQDAVLAIGNYGEAYETRLRSHFSRNGRNLLNGNTGAQLYPLPGLMA